MNCSFFLFLYVCTINLGFCTTRLLAEPIIGGFPDEHNFYRQHVTIYEKDAENNYESVCGATIFSEKHVLTAAHCFMTKQNGIVTARSNIGNGLIKIIAGTSRLYGPGIEKEIIRVFIPRSFNVGENIVVSDIAVAELRSDLGVERNSHSIERLPIGGLFPYDYEAGKEALFCGFGMTRTLKKRHRYKPDKSSIPEIKQCLIVFIKSNSGCVNYDSAICGTSISPKHTSCYGDSGAGLVFENHLIGILSQGPPDCYSTTMPMRFTRISYFQDFINRVMNENSDKRDMHIIKEGPQPSSRGEGSSRYPGGHKRVGSLMHPSASQLNKKSPFHLPNIMQRHSKGPLNSSLHPVERAPRG